MSRNYQVAYELRDAGDEKTQESMGLATEPSLQQNNLLQWMDQIQLPINDIHKETRLFVTLQTEQVGITKGLPIASGEADLADMKIFTEANAKGEFKSQFSVELTDPNGVDGASKIQLKFKFKPNPNAGPPNEVIQEEKKVEENAEEVEEAVDEILDDEEGEEVVEEE